MSAFSGWVRLAPKLSLGVGGGAGRRAGMTKEGARRASGAPVKAVAEYRRVLAIREARLLIGASAASQVGDWLYNAALLGYVYSATHSAAWVAVATIFRLLPFVLLGPLGGAIADRYPRRTVLVSGSLLRLALMLVLAAVVAGHAPVAVVIAIVAVSSTAGTAETPTTLAALPRLVGEARIGPANALLHTVQDLAVVIGPAIGALLLAVASAPAAFIANAGLQEPARRCSRSRARRRAGASRGSAARSRVRLRGCRRSWRGAVGRRR